MTPERWQQVEELFAAALDRPGAERPVFLDRVCDGDAELQREVLALLAAEPPAAGFLDHPVLAPPARDQELAAGGHVGPYRILHRLGSGGMGIIYLAERDDGQYRQQVAVKVLRTGMESAALVRRFRNERQVLARLEHPYIARLLDGGATPDGLPYLAMEHVEGEPIDRYCQRRHVSLRARLELFCKVCDGVQFLHQNLVLHRDLKPANILVRADGVPKLLDFGIAKLLQPEVLALPATTTAGPTPLTIDYASPEQVRGEVLTTTSDVYSLGVLLYHLLAGESPYSPARSLPEKLNQICHQEPPVPSRRARQKSRRGMLAALPRRLAGDLDAIVLRALDKQPRRRYASAEQLGEDLRRYLVGRPVAARQHTAIYRASKFLRRNWRVAATVTALLLLLAGFTVQLKLVGQQALQERDRAEEVSEFLVELFSAPDVRHGLGGEVTARQLLDAGTAKIRGELRNQPEVRAKLLATMGRSYLGLGLHDEAAPRLEESVTLWRQVGGAPRERAAALAHLAHLRLRQARYEEAEALFRETVALLENRPQDEAERAAALHNLAGLLSELGRLAAAEQSYREALAIRLRHQAEQPGRVADTWNRLAGILGSYGRHAEAELYVRQALALYRQGGAAGKNQAAINSNALAEVLHEQGCLEAAEALFLESLAARQRSYGPDHQMVAFVLHGLGHLRLRQGRLDEAEALYRRTFDMLRARLEPGHPYLGVTQRSLAAVQLARGETTTALATTQQALAVLRAALPADHWRVAEAESLLGDCLLRSGDAEQAARYLRHSCRILEATLGHRSGVTREARERLRRLGPASSAAGDR